MKILTALLSATMALAMAFPLQAQQQDVFDPSESHISDPPDTLDGSSIVPTGTSCGDELFNSGPFVTSTGDGPGGSDVSLLQNVSLGLTTLGAAANLSGAGPHFRMADDFVVTEDSQVKCLVIYAYQTGSTTTSSMTGASIRLWDGPPNDAGSSVVFGDTTTNRMLDTGWTGVYRYAETAIGNTQRPVMWLLVDLGDTILSPGTYWIDWQAAGSIASGPWAPPITIIGQTTTGNALQLISTGWQAFNDGGTVTPQGIPFLVLGVAGDPVLDLSTNLIDFGPVAVGQSATGLLEITNTGGLPLEVTSVTAAAAPFSVSGGSCDPVPFTLAATESCTVEFEFSPTVAGPASQVIDIESNGGDDAVTLQGAGVEPELGLSTTLIDFGSVAVGQSAQGTLTISNDGGATLEVTGMTPAAAPFSVTGGTCGPVPFTLAPAASCTVEFTFSPTVVGPASQVIDISSDGGDGAVTLQGNGTPVLPVARSIPGPGAVALILLALITLGVAGWRLRATA
jgi:hypothetical protein